jgi:hypothetical protein
MDKLLQNEAIFVSVHSTGVTLQAAANLLNLMSAL